MQQELAREKADLILPGMQRPYFMEYRLEDIHNYEARGQLRSADGRGRSASSASCA